MKQGDCLLIQGVKFIIKARQGSRLLVEFMDSKAGLVTRWIIWKGL